MPEMREPDDGMRLAHAPVVSEFVVYVRRERRLPLVTIEPRFLDHPVGVGTDDASFAARDDLGRIEGERRGLAERAGVLAAVRTPVGMRGILKEEDVTLPAQLDNLLHVGRDDAADVHDHDAGRPLGDRRPQTVHVHRERLRIAVHKPHDAPRMHHAERRGEKCVRRDDDFFPPHIVDMHRDLDGTCPAVDHDGMLRPDKRAQTPLQAVCRTSRGSAVRS